MSTCTGPYGHSIILASHGGAIRFTRYPMRQDAETIDIVTESWQLVLINGNGRNPAVSQKGCKSNVPGAYLDLELQ